VAFIMMLFATVSPYMLWNRYYKPATGISSTLASGAFIASSASSGYPCGWFAYCTVGTAWTYWSQFEGSAGNALCTDPISFQNFGRYGFCSNLNGATADNTFVVAPQIKAIQGLSISATVVLFLASIAALAAPATGSKAGYSSTLLAFLGAALTTATFSVACSFSYYQSFGSSPGGYLPTIGTFTNGTSVALLNSPTTLYWGPAFVTTVLAAVVAWIATCVMGAASRQLDDDLDGTYGGGAAYNQPGMQYGGGMQYGATQQYGYDVSKA